MTKQEIANVIRDFVIDVGTRLGSYDDPIVEELRKFADRVEGEEEDEEPITPATTPSAIALVNAITEPNDYLHGEER